MIPLRNLLKPFLLESGRIAILDSERLLAPSPERLLHS